MLSIFWLVVGVNYEKGRNCICGRDIKKDGEREEKNEY